MNKGISPDIRELLALRHYAADIGLFGNKKVTAALSGNRMSHARGRGMDFEEVRAYQSGDDIRRIHWPLTARLGKPFTKIYREERERAVYLLVDQSASMQFGTRVCFKAVLAAKIAALLGWAALNNHEQIGGIVFNDNYSEFIRPKRSRQALLTLFNLMTGNNAIRQQNGGLESSLQFLSQRLQSGSVVIVISDYFRINPVMTDYLRIIARKCDLINLFIYDNLETTLPKSGNFAFTLNGKLNLEIQANSKNNAIYTADFVRRCALVKDLARNNNMQFAQLATDDNLVHKINQEIKKYGY